MVVLWADASAPVQVKATLLFTFAGWQEVLVSRAPNLSRACDFLEAVPWAKGATETSLSLLGSACELSIQTF